MEQNNVSVTVSKNDKQNLDYCNKLFYHSKLIEGKIYFSYIMKENGKADIYSLLQPDELKKHLRNLLNDIEQGEIHRKLKLT